MDLLDTPMKPTWSSSGGKYTVHCMGLNVAEVNKIRFSEKDRHTWNVTIAKVLQTDSRLMALAKVTKAILYSRTSIRAAMVMVEVAVRMENYQIYHPHTVSTVTSTHSKEILIQICGPVMRTSTAIATGALRASRE